MDGQDSTTYRSTLDYSCFAFVTEFEAMMRSMDDSNPFLRLPILPACTKQIVGSLSKNGFKVFYNVQGNETMALLSTHRKTAYLY